MRQAGLLVSGPPAPRGGCAACVPSPNASRSRCFCVCACARACVCACVRGVGGGGAQSCPALCHHMDCSLPDSFVHGIFQARVLEQVAISCARGFSRFRDRTRVSCVSCSGGQVLYRRGAWEAAELDMTEHVKYVPIPWLGIRPVPAAVETESSPPAC